MKSSSSSQPAGDGAILDDRLGDVPHLTSPEIEGSSPVIRGDHDAIRVVVQQRHRLFRHGLAMLLRDERDIEVVGTAATGTDLLQVCDQSRPDVVLLETDAVEWDACRVSVALCRRHTGLRVIGLQASCDPTAVRRAYRAGMTALVARSAGLGPVLEVVRDRTNRRAVIPFTAPHRPEEPKPLSLTKRECEVLLHVGSGETSREICLQLGISRKTVENHKQRIFAKLDVQNQAHAIALAMRRGLLTHPSAGTPVTG